MSKPDVDFLAKAYDKPVEYVQRCLAFHGITSLPKFRTSDDGLSDFYSDMTASFFDPNFTDSIGPDAKPFYPARSMTKPEFTDELDLNVIMARYKASNFDPSTLPTATKQALYGDFTAAPESYHAALNFITDTQRSFMTLDAELRARFDNDPQKFLDFVADPANHDELLELGLAVPAIPSIAESIKNGVLEGMAAAQAAPLPDSDKKPSKGSKSS